MRRSNAKPQAFDPNPPPPKMDAPKLHHRPARRSSPRIVVVVVAAISLILVIIYLFIASRTSNSSEFGIVIDGGSTGTRIHVFSYKIESGSIPVLDFSRTASMKVSPGLSFYSDDPERAGESLVELLEFGKARVPRNRQGDTEVRLMGTAGLRLVDVGIAERILESCRKVLRGSGFRFEDDWATVISGSNEGIYAWVAANYALGTLGGDPQMTTGIFELGGASAQVTFVSGEPLPPEFSHVLKFGEVSYNLYSHSFLHLGQNVAHESLRELLSSSVLKTSAEFFHEGTFRDPCTPKGYLHGAESLKLSAGALNLKMEYRPVAYTVGNFSECRSAALMLLQKEKDKCLYSSCLLGSSFIPKLRGRFIATENFFYTSKFFGLDPASFLSDLILAGERFCQEDWSKLKRKFHTIEEEDLARYCFSSAYIVALLHDSLGIAMDDKRIVTANQVGDVPLDWALGAFIMQKMSNQDNSDHSGLIASIFSDNSTVLPICVVSMVLIFTGWSLKRWSKPQLKTIYDLEKGRYITTRIGR